MTHHTTDTQRGAGLRVTREQVENVLQINAWGWNLTTVRDICRDWLDMGDRLAVAERERDAIAVAAEQYLSCMGEYDGDGFMCTDYADALELLLTTTHTTEVSSTASEEDGCE